MPNGGRDQKLSSDDKIYALFVCWKLIGDLRVFAFVSVHVSLSVRFALWCGALFGKCLQEDNYIPF